MGDVVTGTTAAISAINAATTIIKHMANGDKALATADLKLQLANAMDALISAKQATLDTVEENKALKARLVLQDEMKFEKPFYYRHVGQNKEGPFCPQCFDSEGKAIRLHQYEKRWFECKTCKEQFCSDYEAENNAKMATIRGYRSSFEDYDDQI